MGEEGMFKVKTPRFSTIILDDSSRDEKLCLPKLFTAEYGALLPDKVLLKIPSGAEWQVGLLKSGEKIWFHDGWREFAEFYSLASGQLLVFEYSSHAHFLVLIFDKTAAEITYGAQNAYVDVESESEADASNETLDDRFFSRKARGKRPLRSPQPHKLKRRRNESGRLGRNSGAVFCHGSTSSGMAKQGKRAVTGDHSSQGEEHEDNQARKGNQTFQRRGSLTAAEKVSALARANAGFRPKNPSFMLVMQPACVCRARMSLNLPRSFFEKNVERKLGDIVILQVPDGRAWEVKYHIIENERRKSKFIFGMQSWATFAQENSLKIGDVCAFELVKRGSKPVFNVVIFPDAHDANHLNSSAYQFEKGMKSSSRRRTGYGRSSGTGSSVASEAANAFTSRQPCFKIAVASSHLNMGQVTIPVSFHEHVMEVYDEVELRVVGGKCWGVRIRRCSRVTGQQLKLLGMGWGAFAAGNSLEVGDVCVYELVKREDENREISVMVLNVHIFRG